MCTETKMVSVSKIEYRSTFPLHILNGLSRDIYCCFINLSSYLYFCAIRRWSDLFKVEGLARK